MCIRDSLGDSLRSTHLFNHPPNPTFDSKQKGTPCVLISRSRTFTVGSEMLRQTEMTDVYKRQFVKL